MSDCCGVSAPENFFKRSEFKYDVFDVRRPFYDETHAAFTYI